MFTETQTLFQNAYATHYSQEYLAYLFYKYRNVLLQSVVFRDLIFLFLIPVFPSLLMKHTHTHTCVFSCRSWMAVLFPCLLSKHTGRGGVCSTSSRGTNTLTHTYAWQYTGQAGDRFIFITHITFIHQNIWLCQHMQHWISVCVCWV